MPFYVQHKVERVFSIFSQNLNGNSEIGTNVHTYRSKTWGKKSTVRSTQCEVNVVQVRPTNNVPTNVSLFTGPI
jgi:hypothetical protein